MTKFSVISLSLATLLMSQSSLQAMDGGDKGKGKAVARKNSNGDKKPPVPARKPRASMAAKLVDQQVHQNKVASLKLNNSDISTILADYKAGNKTTVPGAILSLKLPESHMGLYLRPYLTPEYVDAFIEHKLSGSTDLAKLYAAKPVSADKKGISTKLMPVISDKPIIGNYRGSTLAEQVKSGKDAQGQIHHLLFRVEAEGLKDVFLESVIQGPTNAPVAILTNPAVSVTTIK